MDGLDLRTRPGEPLPNPRVAARARATQRALRHAILASVIERDVIPELLGTAWLRRAVTPAPEQETAELTALALGRSARAVTDYVAALHAGGRSAEWLCLHLLTPVARRLGEGWLGDTCDFTDVTIGVWRLHDAMRWLYPVAAIPTLRHTALLVPLPGEQHTFGLAMVREFFRRAGWNAWSGDSGTPGDLVALVRSRRFDVIGVSVSSHAFLDAARLFIAELRANSGNPRVAILVGGAPFLDSPELAAGIGADAAAADAQASVTLANALVAERAPARRRAMALTDRGHRE
jgi:MerR family transcriptional regulator, light-induced transcriptional regulator